MAGELKPIDISDLPDLLRLAEEVAMSGEGQAGRRQGQTDIYTDGHTLFEKFQKRTFDGMRSGDWEALKPLLLPPDSTSISTFIWGVLTSGLTSNHTSLTALSGGDAMGARVTADRQKYLDSGSGRRQEA